MYKYLNIIFVFLFCGSLIASGQSPALKGGDMTSTLFLNDYLETDITSKDDFNLILLHAYQASYFFASIDSIAPTRFVLRLGNKWPHENFIYSNDSIGSNLLPKKLQAAYLNQHPANIIETHLSIIKYLETKGYPFATITSTQQQDSLIFTINQGPNITWDSAQFKGEFEIKDKYLHQAFNVPYNTSYSEATFNKLSNIKIGNLNHIKPPEILFLGKTALPFFYLKETQNNSIGGLIGFNGNGSDFTFTGNISLHLENSFNRLESFELNWESFQNQSQKLQTNLELPYIFASRFGYQIELNLFKQDSSFINTEIHNQLNYHINNSFKLFSGVLLQNSNNLQKENIKKKLYSLGFVFINKSNTFQCFNLSYAGGQRDNNEDKVYQNQYAFRSDLNFKLKKWLHLFSSIQGKHISSSLLAQSELYRLGGFKTIRGFNELSLYTRTFVFNRTELRIPLEEDSFLFGFTDIAYLEQLNTNNRLLGFGAGVQLKSSSGIFSIAYGLGKFARTPIDIKASKIHFGYVSQF